MKRALLYCFGILALAGSASAQVPVAQTWSGFYVGANAGYNFSHAGDLYSGNGFVSYPISGSTSYNTATNVQTWDYKKASYGSGAGVTLHAGYMFNPYVGADLGFNIGVAPKKYTYEDIEVSSTGNIRTVITTYSKTPMSIRPSVVLSTGNNRPLYAYTRLGASFTFGGDWLEEYLYDNDISSVEDLTEEEYEFFSAKGLIGEIGVGYNLSDKLAIMAEFGGTSLVRSTKSSEVVTATSNGVDVLGQYNIEDKMTEYSTNFLYDPNTQTVSTPSRGTSYNAPFSTWGVNIGVRASLSGNQGIDWSDLKPEDVKPFTGYFGSLSVGYNAPHAGNHYLSNGSTSDPISGKETYTSSNNTTSIDYNKASYNSGVGVNLAGGYMFGRHFGAQIGINTVVAPKAYTFTFENITSSGTITADYTTKASMPVYINPAIIISTGSKDPLNLYSRVGIALPVGGKLISERTITNSTTGNVIEETEEYKFFMAKALTGALGARYSLTPNMGLFGEINGMSMTRYTRSSEITSYSVNGADELSGLTTSQKQFEYLFNGTIDPAAATAAQPSRGAPISAPFSTWGVNLGVDLRF